MSKLITFYEVLVDPNKFSWADSLFLPENKNWNLGSPTAVMNLDDLEDEEIPQFALENNLIFVLNISNVQDIIENARQQRNDCSINDLLEAYLYYYRNDAFISFD